MKDDRGTLITFIGSTPRIGTSVTAFSAAYMLAERLNSKVGYICLNLKSSKLHRYLGVDEPEVTLDQLRADLRSGTLTPAKLYESCFRPYKQISLSVLFGNMLREQAELYMPEHVEHLLDTARECFDICVLDVSAYWDNAATIIGMRECRRAILVTNDELACFQEDVQRWLEQGVSLYSISREKLLLWVNQSFEGEGGYSAKQIEKELGIPMIGALRANRKFAKSVHEGKLDIAVQESTWSGYMEDGLKQLFHLMNWIPVNEQRRGTKLSKWIGKKRPAFMKQQKEMKGSV
ncbi:AAA family ATPase [Marinicrinis lubricantis]|uniref:CpaE family protein n=1 Tax=Marinicrinis lubricantis TaxID=2086470 RepID=A0ABW1IJH0_9BACL